MVVPESLNAAAPGIVVANSGGKQTSQFQHWQQFRKNVEDGSNGSLLFDYLIYGELGTSQSMLQAVMNGQATIGGVGCAGITQLIPEMAIPQMPFLFANDDEVDFVFEHYMTPIYSEILAKHGLVLLQWTEIGWMDLYTRTPVQFPSQLENQQIRTVNNIVGPALLKAVKAIPVDIAVTNLDTSVQLDKLFGGFGPLISYARLKSSFKYLTVTHHSFNCGMVVANKAWFDTTTPHEQEVLRNAYPTLHSLRDEAWAENKSLIAKISEVGAVVLQLSNEQHNAWAAAALPLYPSILEQAGGRSIEVYDIIRAAKQAFLRDPASGTHH